jgi:hypothetical protein
MKPNTTGESATTTIAPRMGDAINDKLASACFGGLPLSPPSGFLFRIARKPLQKRRFGPKPNAAALN